VINEIPKESYPLTWPTGQPRTRWRGGSQFKQRGFGLIRDVLLDELRRLDASDVIISSNLRTRMDGLPYADQREPDDPGIAVYFRRKKKPYVIACDTFDRTWKNLRAIGGTVEALRAIERYGASSMLEQAFSGFAALPAHAAEPSWWDVLGVRPEATLAEIEAAHEKLVQQHHPDIGGNHDEMARINRARDIARQERA
jgi:hypothetical protein